MAGIARQLAGKLAGYDKATVGTLVQIVSLQLVGTYMTPTMPFLTALVLTYPYGMSSHKG